MFVAVVTVASVVPVSLLVSMVPRSPRRFTHSARNSPSEGRRTQP
jgi:hypothetical protein